MYYATKDNITKQIQKQDRAIYKSMGWTITQSGDEKYDCYDYDMVKEKGNCLQPIVINGEKFEGYSGFSCINTKTYVEEPSRTLDGSIPNINDYDTFFVPRVNVSFSYMTIDDYRRLIKALTPNEFNVSYYDFEIDRYVTYKMYCEPREMAKIFNKGYEILAITEQTISLIGTLNDVEYLNINYYDNPSGDNNWSLVEQKKIAYGYYYAVKEASDDMISKHSGKRFVGWNTRPDGQGMLYLENSSVAMTRDLDLYAMWE